MLHNRLQKQGLVAVARGVRSAGFSGEEKTMRARSFVFFAGLPVVLALAACGRQDAPEPRAAPEPPAAQASLAAQAALADCVPLRQWQDAAQGKLTVHETPEEERVLLGFEIVQGGKTLRDAMPIPADSMSAVALDSAGLPERLTVCADRWFILDMPEERGGLIVVAERLNGGLSMRLDDYEGEDEDELAIAMADGQPHVKTRKERARPIQGDDAPGRLAAGSGVPQTLACESKDRQGTQLLELKLDSTGRLASVGYSSIMPTGASCQLDVARGDGHSAWTEAADRVAIGWDGQEPDGSKLLIRREGGRFVVDPSMVPPMGFCGQSAQMALSLSLSPGEKSCQAVQWPAN